MAPRNLNQQLEKARNSEPPISYRYTNISLLSSLKERKNLLKDRIVEGYAVIWGSINDRGERFVKGCFAKSISDLGPASNSAYKIKFRDRHGKSVSLFAELKEDDIGLYFKTVPLDNVQWANDLLTQLESGTINNFSIGFRHVWDKVEWDADNECMINLEAFLFEISAVDIPSDMETYAMRSIEEIEYLNEDIEDFITSLPKTKQLEARKIITRCFSLSRQEQLEQEGKQALEERKQKKTIDYSGLNSLLKEKQFS